MKRKAPKEMPKKSEHTVLGWKIYFERNVYTYTHSLLVSKNEKQININCEWLGPEAKDGNGVGIWLYGSEITDETKKELANVLSLWAKEFEVHIRVFVTREEFIDNQ